ncbi:MAG: SWIM zinc finger family protein [Xanthomonadales bacterium]|nr:SWIM zinc finger family protein [Xanthomonadales bacterium]
MLDAAAVLALAPDSSSAKAGQGLASLRHWSGLGRNAESWWGLCQGSGKDPYQARVALADLSSGCSCPSRKFPCKHVIALMLLGAQGALPEAEAPAFVSEWMAKKVERAERKQKVEAERTPEQLAKAAAAAERRAETRLERRAEGLADLRLWMADLVRSGMGNAPVTEASFWEARARRLVDAQLPGLARRLERCYGHAIRRPDWPEAVLRELGNLELAISAFDAIDSMSAPQRADLERALGSAQSLDGEQTNHVHEDHFLCLGVVSEALDNLTLQRSWWANAQARLAMVLSFTANGVPLPSVAVPGRSERLRLQWYPGSQPLRAQLLDRQVAEIAVPAPAESVASALDRFARALAADPWLERLAICVSGCLRLEAGQVYLCDREGVALPLGPSDGRVWRWLAQSRGRCWCFAGEWDGEILSLMHGWPA